LARMFRSAPGPTISKTSFFDLGGGDMDVSLETLYHKRIFEVV
jgi:hypothetical protein